jgi:hypothetical protein
VTDVGPHGERLLDACATGRTILAGEVGSNRYQLNLMQRRIALDPCQKASPGGITDRFGEELGLDHYQLMSAVAIVRFWMLALVACVFLNLSLKAAIIRSSYTKSACSGSAILIQYSARHSTRELTNSD